MQTTGDTGHPRRWAILGVMVVSLLVVVLDNTVLNVALRTLADPEHGLGATQSQLEWSINSYTLVFAGLLFTFGVLGDRWGRRLMLAAGLVIFALSSLASAYANDPTQLIAARALMGVGGAAIMPATLSIISNVFDPRERARAIGVWAGAVGLGAAIGPIIGGVLLENFWWGSIFLINVPIIAAGLVAVMMLVPESRDPKPGRIDVVGVALTIVGLATLVYGIIDGGEHGFGRGSVWAWIGLGVAALAVFVWWEARVRFPSLDVRLFREPRFAAAVAVVGLIFFAMMGVFFFMSFYLQLVRGYSPLQTGLLLLPFAAAQLVFAPRSAALVKKYGAKAVSSVGLAIVTLAMAGYLLVGVDSSVWLVIVMFFLFGAGMANVMPPAMEAIMASLPRERAGVGSAVSNTVRQVGAALGIAVLGSILASTYRSGIGDVASGLPAKASAAASESISGAYAAAEGLAQAGQAPAAGALIQAANVAFVDAVHAATIGSVVVGLVALVVSARFLPGRAAPDAGAAAATGGPADAAGHRDGGGDEAAAGETPSAAPERATVR